MKYARPAALRANCPNIRPCFSTSPLSSILLDTQSLPLFQRRAVQKHITPTLRCFSSSQASLARKRFIPTPQEDQARKSKKKTTSRRRDREAHTPTWEDYDPEVGIPLPSGELDQITITGIFGPDMPEEKGNHILRLMNYRRLSGSLIDVGVEFPAPYKITLQEAAKALEHVRTFDPDFDENEAGIAWADAEIRKVEEEYMTRATNLGIYKRDPSDPAPAPQGTEYGRSVYGESALDAIRAANRKRWMEEDLRKKASKDAAEKERVAALRAQSHQEDPEPSISNEEPGKIHSDFDEIALAQPLQKAWLQPVERKPWVKYYEEQATILKSNAIPQLSILSRLGPATVILLLVLGGCYTLDTFYTPPPRSARMFPDIPPAAATVGGIIAANVAVFIAWRIPPLWRTMNKYFMIVPAYPFAASVFFAQFSHTGFKHLFFNSVLLVPFGMMLNEDIGRGTFLATYLACGIFGGYGSLVFNVLKHRFSTYIYGSSTAVYGIVMAACLIRPNDEATLFGYTIPNVTGLTLLGAIGGGVLLSAWRGASVSTDYPGHVCGVLGGVASGWLVRYKRGVFEKGKMDEGTEGEIKDAEGKTEGLMVRRDV